MPPPQKPNNPLNEQKLMEDILQGRLTIAQLAELQKQRRLHQQTTVGGRQPQHSQPGAARIASDKIEPDRTLPSGAGQGRPASSGKASSSNRQRSPATRPPGGQSPLSKGGQRLVPVAVPGSRPSGKPRQTPAAKPASQRTSETSATPANQAAAADRQPAASQAVSAPTPSVNQQIHRILASQRGARTAWLLSEILGPPVALRPADDRRF
jgi:hypothetical protein